MYQVYRFGWRFGLQLALGTCFGIGYAIAESRDSATVRIVANSSQPASHSVLTSVARSEELNIAVAPVKKRPPTEKRLIIKSLIKCQSTPCDGNNPDQISMKAACSGNNPDQISIKVEDKYVLGFHTMIPGGQVDCNVLIGEPFHQKVHIEILAGSGTVRNKLISGTGDGSLPFVVDQVNYTLTYRVEVISDKAPSAGS